MFHAQQRQNAIRSRREKRKLAKHARTRRQLLRYALLAVLMMAGYSAFRYIPAAVTDLERDVTIEGNHVVEPEQIRDVLREIIGEPVYKLDPRVLERRICSLEAVKTAFVHRYIFPHPHLVVYVLEECPWASFASDPGHPPVTVLSQTGRLIPIDRFGRLEQPKFTIYGPPDFTMTAKQVAQLADWTDYIAAQTGQPVNFVDLRSPNDIRIQDGEYYLKVGSMDSTLTRRLSRLASVVPALAEYQGRINYIDLGLDNNVPIKIAEHVMNPANRQLTAETQSRI